MISLFGDTRRFLKKGRRAIAVILAVSLLCGISGCKKEQTDISEDGSDISVGVSDSISETGFDIERIRKNVIVDGQAIEIPIKLKDLPEDWTYEVTANRFAEDRCHVKIKDKNGDFLFSCGAEGYKGSKEGDCRIFDAPFENDKCSVDGITPFETTREEIVDRYGEAANIRKFTSKKYDGWEEYQYGSLEGKTSNDWHGKCLIVTFNEKGIVDWVAIVYTD